MTKKEVLNYLADTVVPTLDADMAAEVSHYITSELARLEKKAADAKKYAAKKKDEIDALAEKILGAVPEDWTPIADIAEVVGDTPGKVSARLNKLFTLGLVEKGNVNTAAEGEKKRVVVAYKITRN